MDEPESRRTPGLGLASQEGSRVRVPSPPRKRQVTGLNSRRVEHCGPLGAKHTSRARLPLRLAVLVECAGDHRQVLVAEAVIDTIESESLLANVRQVSTYIRSNCITGPVTGTQGAGFLLGLKTSRPAKEVQAALMERNILTGTSGDPNVLRLLPAYILNEGHVDRLCDALSAIPA